jgi:hypothetical protein
MASGRRESAPLTRESGRPSFHPRAPPQLPPGPAAPRAPSEALLGTALGPRRPAASPARAVRPPAQRHPPLPVGDATDGKNNKDRHDRLRRAARAPDSLLPHSCLSAHHATAHFVNSLYETHVKPQMPISGTSAPPPPREPRETDTAAKTRQQRAAGVSPASQADGWPACSRTPGPNDDGHFATKGEAPVPEAEDRRFELRKGLPPNRISSAAP